MPPSEEITIWAQQVRTGDHEAARRLWEAYYHRLVGLARKKLAGLPRRVVDEEDVALSAFHSFCQGVAQGRFPRLDDRDDLWQVLVLVTARKVADLRDHDRRPKHGGGQVRGDSAFLELGEEEGRRGLEQVVGKEPTPEFAAEVAEECRRLLEALGDETLRAVALGKMEGYTNEELATRQRCSLATVERKLGRIRRIWEKM